jgi:hypothetical protein
VVHVPPSDTSRDVTRRSLTERWVATRMLLLLGANDGSTQHAVGGTRRYCGDMTDSPHLGAANDVDDAHHRGAGTFSKSVPDFEWPRDDTTCHQCSALAGLAVPQLQGGRPHEMTTLARITISTRGHTSALGKGEQQQQRWSRKCYAKLMAATMTTQAVQGSCVVNFFRLGFWMSASYKINASLEMWTGDDENSMLL